MATDEDDGARVRRGGHDKVRVWTEVTIRVSAGNNDYDFIRFTHGQESLTNNNPKARARAERELHASVLEIVEARATEFVEMVTDLAK